MDIQFFEITKTLLKAQVPIAWRLNKKEEAID